MRPSFAPSWSSVIVPSSLSSAGVQGLRLGQKGDSRPVISWDTKAGRSYTVYATTNTSRPWTNSVYQVALGDGSRQRYTNDVNTGVRFFRVGVRLQN